MDAKRGRDSEGGDGDYGASKMPRTDVMAALDIRIVNKLDDMVAAGLMAHGDLDAKALGELSQFEPSEALQVLEQFQHAGLENIRNKSAYLHGVMVRFRKESTPRLEPEVEARLERLYRSSKVKASDLDHRVFEALNNLPPPVAVRAIERFQSKVSDDVRNISAFFTSLLRQEEQNLSSYGPSSRGGGGGGYGSYREPEPLPRYHRPHDAYGDGYPDDPYGPPPPRMPPPAHMPPLHPAPMPHHLAPAPGMHAPPSMPPGPHGQAPQVLVISPDQLQQPISTASVQALLPQILAALQQQQQPQQVAYAPPAVMPPPQPQVAPVPPGMRRYGPEQAALGVRINEFHGLSVFSEFVHPAPALKLQQLWDGGNRLVSLLDDRTWEALAQLPAPEALAVIDQVVENMKRQELRNPNAFFMSCAKKFLEKARLESQSYGRPQPYGGPSPRPYAQQAGGGQRGPPPTGRAPPSAGSGGSGVSLLPESLQRPALSACARHHPMLTESMFDEGVVEGFRRLSEEDAAGVFEELLAADLSNVRNVPAYLMGMIRKRRQEGPVRRQ